MSNRVVVVGAGISGLATAFRIRALNPSLEVLVLEPQALAGGTIRTISRDGFRVEAGPNGFLDSKPSTLQLCKDVGIGSHLLAASEGSRKNRYLFLNEKLQRMPSSPLGIFTTPILSPIGRLSLLMEPFRRRSSKPRGDESVAMFARRRFGKQAADTFIDGLVTGIHGGDPEQLSLRSAFPRLALFEEQAGSVLRGFLRASKAKRQLAKAQGQPKPGPARMWSFPDGLGELIAALTKALGHSLLCGVNVQRIFRKSASWVVEAEGQQTWTADAVVLACPPANQAIILADVDSQLSQEINGIPSNRIAVVALGYRDAQAPLRPEGFGYIAPQRTGRPILGVQWCSSIFPGRAPQGAVLWRALCGGVHRTDVCDYPDDELARVVHKELQLAMGVTGEPIFREIVRWPKAIPQYIVGHSDRLVRIFGLAAKHPGLYLTGNGYRGVALNDCTEQAGLVAQTVVQGFAKTPDV